MMHEYLTLAVLINLGLQRLNAHTASIMSQPLMPAQLQSFFMEQTGDSECK